MSDGRPVLRLAAGAVTLAAVTALSLIAAEAATRLFDGYALTSLRLAPAGPRAQSSGNGKFPRAADAAFYLDRLPLAAGVDRKWFTDPLPARPTYRVDSELQRRSDRYSGDDALRTNYEWNETYLRRVLCGGPENERVLFAGLDDVFVFEAPDRSARPTLRFLRSVTYPDGLHTNAFGWRSQQIALRKPPRTVRVAFVGSSAVVAAHALPYSFPEIVGIWLNRWASARGLDVRFEAINAGREAINSTSIQAVVTQELMPVEPDFVVYYEGGNQFWPGDYLGAITLPPRPRDSAPRPGRLAQHSAIASRIGWLVRHAARPGVEPPKTTFDVHWPKDLDERDPDLSYANLPVNLTQILSDLDTIRKTTDANGSRFVLTSFMWLVYPGMVLDPARDAFLFDYLNIGYWPFSYAHMRRFLDFQARVFRKYADAHRLDFIDFANEYPRDPRLFTDAVHMTSAGIELQAWIMFNGLVPIVDRAIAAGTLPRDDTRLEAPHPAFGPRRLVDVHAVKNACASATAQP